MRILQLNILSAYFAAISAGVLVESDVTGIFFIDSLSIRIGPYCAKRDSVVSTIIRIYATG